MLATARKPLNLCLSLLFNFFRRYQNMNIPKMTTQEAMTPTWRTLDNATMRKLSQGLPQYLLSHQTEVRCLYSAKKNPKAVFCTMQSDTSVV
jgi:hypothetical protein